MKLNQLYKHINNTDVAFEPVKLVSESEESLTFSGKWVNIVLSNPDYIDSDTITIKKTDLPNWKEFTLDDH